MAKTSHKKKTRVDSDGIAFIKATFNNTVITLTDKFGNTISWASAGVLGFKGSKKSTPFAATQATQKAVEEAAQFEEADRLLKERIDAKNGLENLTYNYKNSLNDERIASKISEEDKKVALEACEKTIAWLDNANEASVEEYTSQKTELEDIIQPIMSKLYGGDTPMDDPNPQAEEVD